MASSSGFLAGGLADFGSQVATGLLGGQELLAREQERRRLAQHQTFLDRLNLARLAAEQQRLGQPTLHGNRGVFPLPSGGYEVRDLSPTPETPLQGAQRASAEATRAWREKQIKALDQPKGPTDPIKVLEAGISEALQRGDTATAEKLESVLKRLTSLTQKPAKVPTERERLTQDWLTQHGLPDTPENRLKSPYRPLSIDEQRQKDEERDTRVLNRAVTVMDARAQAQEAMKEAAEKRKEQRAEQKSAERRQAVTSDLDRLFTQATKLNDAGLLPPSDATRAGMWWASIKRDWWDPTNKNLIAFRGLWGPIMIGEVDRGVFDEKGVRAILAFRAQFDMLERIPSLEAINELLRVLKESIRDRGHQGDVFPLGQGGGPSNDPLGIRR